MELEFSKRKQLLHKQKSIEKKLGVKESAIQHQCEEYLTIIQMPYIRVPDLVYKAIFGGINVKPHLRMLASKFLKGIPDITLLHPNGKYLCVELKTPNGKQSQGQISFQKKIKDNYIVCRSFDEFMDIVNKFNIEKGVSI